MSIRELLVVAAAALVTAAAFMGSGGSAPTLVADAVRTPGVVNPDVTQETIGSTICRDGWTRTIRPPTSYTSDLKVKQMHEYGVTGSPDEFQEDHLISLELGGEGSRKPRQARRRRGRHLVRRTRRA